MIRSLPFANQVWGQNRPAARFSFAAIPHHHIRARATNVSYASSFHLMGDHSCHCNRNELSDKSIALPASMTEIGSPSAQAAGRVRYQRVILVGLTGEILQCRQLMPQA